MPVFAEKNKSVVESHDARGVPSKSWGMRREHATTRGYKEFPATEGSCEVTEGRNLWGCNCQITWDDHQPCMPIIANRLRSTKHIALQLALGYSPRAFPSSKPGRSHPYDSCAEPLLADVVPLSGGYLKSIVIVAPSAWGS